MNGIQKIGMFIAVFALGTIFVVFGPLIFSALDGRTIWFITAGLWFAASAAIFFSPVPGEKSTTDNSAHEH